MFALRGKRDGSRTRTRPSNVDLQELVAEADTGGRKPTGITGRLIFGIAVAWSLFQLWYASPLPFMLGFGVFNDTEARAFHLGFALFLAFTAYPAFTIVAAHARSALRLGSGRARASARCSISSSSTSDIAHAARVCRRAAM